MSVKNPLTQPEIEPATFQFVAQRLYHCATAVPYQTVWNKVKSESSLHVPPLIIPTSQKLTYRDGTHMIINKQNLKREGTESHRLLYVCIAQVTVHPASRINYAAPQASTSDDAANRNGNFLFQLRLTHSHKSFVSVLILNVCLLTVFAAEG
jgi:hypothetical protein